MAVARNEPASVEGKKDEEEDVISYYGSISGESFSARRRKNTCSLRQHKHDLLAKRLREYPFDNEKQDTAIEGASGKKKTFFNRSFHGYRYFVVLMGGTSLGLMIFLRYSITISILNMVNQTALYMDEHPNSTVDEFLAEGYSLGGEFDWDNTIQQSIMSWYMIAYTLPQVFTTRLGLIVGSQYATPISLLICSIATIVTPPAAYLGYEYVIALRLLNGIGASAVLPLMLNLIEQWLPPSDISLGLTLAQVQQSLLCALNPLITGYLSSIHWSYSFYVSGLMTIVFCVIWLVTITDRPDDNWLISEKELKLICSCEEPNQKPSENKSEDKDRRVVQPGARVTDVLSVPSFYAFLLIWSFHASSTGCFGFVLPTYLRQFLKIKVTENGWYCFIIQLGAQIAILWPHPVLQLLKRVVSETTSSRISMVIICIGTGVTWALIGAFHQFQPTLLFLSRCFQPSVDVVATGALMSNYSRTGLSSIVFSMINTIGNLAVVFTSTSLGYYLDKTSQSVEGWSVVWFALAISQVALLILYCCCVKTDPIELKSQRAARLASQKDKPKEVITQE